MYHGTCSLVTFCVITDDHMSLTPYAGMDATLCEHHLVWYNRLC